MLNIKYSYDGNRNILKECAHQMNKCVIIVTHSNDLAKEADVVMKLQKGNLQIALHCDEKDE